MYDRLRKFLNLVIKLVFDFFKAFMPNLAESKFSTFLFELSSSKMLKKILNDVCILLFIYHKETF